MRVELGDDDYIAVEWYANGLGGQCVILAERRIESRAADVASGAEPERVAADAERIAAGAAAAAVADA